MRGRPKTAAVTGGWGAGAGEGGTRCGGFRRPSALGKVRVWVFW